jgi:hypothetical protein
MLMPASASCCHSEDCPLLMPRSVNVVPLDISFFG